MDLTYSEEQEMFRKSVRDFAADRVPPDRLAEIADGDQGWDPALWKEAVGLGLAGVGVPEKHGGAGMGFVEEAIAAEELGRAVFPGPWLGAAVLAQPALAEAPDLLAAVARGDRVATVVGLGRYVVDLPAADLLVVLRDGVLVAVDREDVAWRSLPTVDGTRRLGEVTGQTTGGEELARGDRASAIVEATTKRLRAALAAEAVGVSSEVLDRSVAYTAERQQFGTPIGKYQAVSHQLADTFMDVELARSLALWAAVAIASNDPDAGTAAATAASFAAEAAVRATERAIQVHGGIGFTWEQGLHRPYKRALWIQAFLGDRSELREMVAASLLDGTS
jgi:alkylation response protein AidB-like acyl-CoA dehydrogenase